MLNARVMFPILISMQLLFPCPIRSQERESPLSPDKKRQVLEQLWSYLDILKKTMPEMTAEIAKLKAAVEKEQVERTAAIEAEKKLTAAAEAERDVFKQKAELCETTSKIVKKKRSFGCWLKKIFTAWMSGCR